MDRPTMTYELTQLLLVSIQLFFSSVYFNHLSNKIDSTSQKLDEVLKEIKNWEQVKEEE